MTRSFRPVTLALVLFGGLWLGLAGGLLPSETVTGQAGGLHFVDGAGNPVANTTVHLLCYSANTPAAFLADLQVQTDADGSPTKGPPPGCNYVAALRLRHEQPSGKPGHGPAYRVYATSWPPGSGELKPVTGDVPIRDDRPLVLFDVVASLAWQPAAGSPYPSELRQGLRRASAYLYDLTDGRMALGPVTIYAGGRGWDGADLRFLADNTYRPSAQVGGIVPTARPYTAAPSGAQTVYAPGAIFLGRFWDGLDASNAVTGAWSQPDAFRTLAHEWAHYALFLYDEYRQTAGAETYCTCDDLPKVRPEPDPGVCAGVSADVAASAMAYHYTASEFWLSGTFSVCEGTDQDRVHGEPDWETLRRWGSIQGVTDWIQPPPATSPGPSSPNLADALFGRRLGHRLFLPLLRRGDSPGAAIFEPTVTLVAGGSLTPDQLRTLHPQVYVLKGPGSSSPTQILSQGTTNGNSSSGGPVQITLLGVAGGERACVSVDRYQSDGVAGGRFVYPLPGSADPPLADGQTLRVVTDTWRASLDVTYGMTGPRLTTMTVSLTSPDPLPASPVAQLCTPAVVSGCPAAWRKPMQGSGTTWAVTFAPLPGSDELPLYSVLRVQAAGVGELIRWIQVAGGVGPAHIDGHAPLRDGPVMVDAATVPPGERNRVIVMPAADYTALITHTNGIGGIVGVPFDIDVLLPVSPAQVIGAGGPTTARHPSRQPADRRLPGPVTLTLFYSQETVDRVGVDESQLVVLHFSRGTGAWSVVPGAGRSEVLDWLATGPVQEDGIYAVGWRPSADLSLHKVAQPDPAVAGAVLSYTLRVQNAGPSPATNVIAGDQLPGQVAPLSAPPECEPQPKPGGLICFLGDLAAGARTELLITVQVDPRAGGPLINTAGVASEVPDPDLTNNQAQTVTPVVSPTPTATRRER